MHRPGCCTNAQPRLLHSHIVFVSPAAAGGVTDDTLHRAYGIAALMRGYYPDENRPLTYVYDKGTSHRKRENMG